MQLPTVAVTWLMATALYAPAAARPAAAQAPDTTRAHFATRLAALALTPADTPTFPRSALPPGPPRDPRLRADTLSATVAIHRVWTFNERGFFYTSTPRPWQIYYHWARRPDKQDLQVYEGPDGSASITTVELSEGGRYAVITATHISDQRTRIRFLDLDDADHPVIDAPTVKLFDDLDARYIFAGNIGPQFYVWTNRDAPNGRVMGINSDEPTASPVRTIIAESPLPLLSAHVSLGRLFGTYLEEGRTTLRLFSPSGVGRVAGKVIPLPGDGTVGATVVVQGKHQADTLYYAYQSVLVPPSVFGFELHGAASFPVSVRTSPFDSAAYVLRRITDSTARGKGAAHVLLYVATPKAAASTATPADSARPAWVDTAAVAATGGSPASPLRFRPGAIAWLELGGVYAVPATSTGAAARAAADTLLRRGLARTGRVTIGTLPPPPQDADALAAMARAAWN